MDSKLKTRLIKINEQIDRLYKTEEVYLSLDSARDHVLARLTANAPSTLSSEASRSSWAKATEEWKKHRESLAYAEATFHKERHKLDLIMKAFDAEYLSFKIEAQAIPRGHALT